jgi:hypothetical protein
MIDANYCTEINFKDGKVKFEIIQLDMYDSYSKNYHVLFSGGIFDGYPIYNKKGDLKRPDLKAYIELYFNSQINSLTDALNGKGKTNNDTW